MTCKAHVLSVVSLLITMLAILTATPAQLMGRGKPSAKSVTVATSHDAGLQLFLPPISYESGGDNPFSVVVADVNGDGKPDLLVGNQCTGPDYCGSPGLVSVLVGTGDGTFQPFALVDSLYVADVNGDSKVDIVATHGFGNGGTLPSGSVDVLLNSAAFQDTTPPVVTLSATPKILWPPNAKMVPVTVSGTITDIGSGVNVNSATYIVKDEYGKVQPKGTIILGSEGAYSFDISLQASRLRSDLDGRRYTVTVQTKDNAGNVGSKTCPVIVPHNHGG
jgi:hypothetical protein